MPLGLADKLFLSLSEAGEFEKDSRLFGRTDRSGTATYHVRPFGRPQIEAYFAATLAAELETAGEDAFLDFAVEELVGLLGSDFARRIKPLHLHRWGIDPLAGGSYSYALPGKADCRAVLAAPVDDRLFFAGEACSTNDYSTAHGAYLTGVAAADQAIAARRGKTSRWYDAPDFVGTSLDTFISGCLWINQCARPPKPCCSRPSPTPRDAPCLNGSHARASWRWERSRSGPASRNRRCRSTWRLWGKRAWSRTGAKAEPRITASPRAGLRRSPTGWRSTACSGASGSTSSKSCWRRWINDR